MPRRNQRPKTPVEQREWRLAAASAAVCDICWESIYPWQDINWDHVIPKSQGGPGGQKNKRLTHSICNTVKGNKIEFTLRTKDDRDALRLLVKATTWARLERAWNGQSDEPSPV